MVIPALINENNQIILESLPICEYLEEKHPQRAILSQDPILKAKIRYFINNINLIEEYANKLTHLFNHFSILLYFSMLTHIQINKFHGKINGTIGIRKVFKRLKKQFKILLVNFVQVIHSLLLISCYIVKQIQRKQDFRLIFQIVKM